MAESGPDEAKLLSRFRIATIAVILVVLVIYVGGGIFQLPGLRDTFQVDPTTLGILVGALLLLLGIETLNRIPGIGK